MQSPHKLRQRLDDLLGPPGPDSDPLELTLRTVVMTVGPMIEGMIEQHPPEALDHMLEGVALYFLKIRSDGEMLSQEFIEELTRINLAAVHGETGAITAEAVPEPEQLQPPAAATSSPEPAPSAPEGAPAAPAPSESSSATGTDPASPPAPDAPAAPSTPAPGPTPHQPEPRPSSPAPPWG